MFTSSCYCTQWSITPDTFLEILIFWPCQSLCRITSLDKNIILGNLNEFESVCNLSLGHLPPPPTKMSCPSFPQPKFKWNQEKRAQFSLDSGHNWWLFEEFAPLWKMSPPRLLLKKWCWCRHCVGPVAVFRNLSNFHKRTPYCRWNVTLLCSSWP